jgi:hypothetical protein
VTNLNFCDLADSKSALSHWHLGPDSNLKADYRASLYLNAMCDGPVSRHLSLRGSLSCHCRVTLMVPDSGRVPYLTPPGVTTSSEARKARPAHAHWHLPCESALADARPAFFFRAGARVRFFFGFGALPDQGRQSGIGPARSVGA